MKRSAKNTATQATQLIGQATPEKIQEWKNDAKNADGIYSLTNAGKTHIAYFKYPNRGEVNAALATANADTALDMYEVFANDTFIGGSEEMLEKESFFLGVVQHMKTVMEGEKMEAVNL